MSSSGCFSRSMSWTPWLRWMRRRAPRVLLQKSRPMIAAGDQDHFSADGTQLKGDEAVIEYAYRSPSGKPIAAITTLVDGRPAEATRGLGVGGAEPRAESRWNRRSEGKGIDHRAPGRAVDVSLLAETADHRKSEPAHVRLVAATRSMTASVCRG